MDDIAPWARWDVAAHEAETRNKTPIRDAGELEAPGLGDLHAQLHGLDPPRGLDPDSRSPTTSGSSFTSSSIPSSRLGTPERQSHSHFAQRSFAAFALGPWLRVQKENR